MKTPDASEFCRRFVDEPDDALLARYLLGTCSEDEKARVEDRFFADEATFERLCCLEDALIEERLDGRLSPDDRTSFDRHDGSGRRRERLLVTAALRRAAAADRSAVPAAKVARRSIVAPRWLALAAAMALAVGAVLVWQNAQLRRALDRAAVDRQALQQQHDADARRIADLETQTAGPARNAAAAPEPAGGQAPLAPSSPSLIATVLLRPGMSRGPQGVPQVVVGREPGTILFRLGIDDPLDYAEYRVELRTARGDATWTLDGVKLQRDGSSVAVTIPASALNPGEHELVLLGRSAAGVYEDAGHYYFDVRQR